jgi:hypothetical protein
MRHESQYLSAEAKCRRGEKVPIACYGMNDKVLGPDVYEFLFVYEMGLHGVRGAFSIRIQLTAHKVVMS